MKIYLILASSGLCGLLQKLLEIKILGKAQFNKQCLLQQYFVFTTKVGNILFVNFELEKRIKNMCFSNFGN